MTRVLDGYEQSNDSEGKGGRKMSLILEGCHDKSPSRGQTQTNPSWNELISG